MRAPPHYCLLCTLNARGWAPLPRAMIPGAVRAVPEASRFLFVACSSTVAAFVQCFDVDVASTVVVRASAAVCGGGGGRAVCVGNNAACQVGEERITRPIWTAHILDGDYTSARATSCVDICVSSGSVFTGWSDGRLRIFNFVSVGWATTLGGVDCAWV